MCVFRSKLCACICVRKVGSCCQLLRGEEGICKEFEGNPKTRSQKKDVLTSGGEMNTQSAKLIFVIFILVLPQSVFWSSKRLIHKLLFTKSNLLAVIGLLPLLLLRHLLLLLQRPRERREDLLQLVQLLWGSGARRRDQLLL